MPMVPDMIPSRIQLQRGVVLATIAHAISVASDPLISYELSWDGMNYSRQDGQGARGTLTFTPDAVIAAFRDENSNRVPDAYSGRYDLSYFFRGIPNQLMALARDETLQYLLDEYQGNIGPIVTAAFWSTMDNLTAVEPWAQVIKHGAHLISNECATPEVAMSKWAEYYDLSTMQISLLQTLYARLVEGTESVIVLTESEYTLLTSAGAYGIEESRELLLAVGIRLPR